MIGDGEDSGMSSNNSLSDGFSESSFSMVYGTAFFLVFLSVLTM